MPRKFSLEHLLTDDSFIRFIKEKATKAEQDYWNQWKDKDPDHQILVEQAKDLIQYTEMPVKNVPDPFTELKKLDSILNQSKQIRRKQYQRPRAANSWWISAAAIVLLALFTGVFLNYSAVSEDKIDNETADYYESQFHTSYGEKASVYLTDGSSMMLNANSNLKYFYNSSITSGQMIDIYLDGEAWFDIIPSESERPRLVRVHTQNGIIEVLGTTFAVQASHNGTRAILEKGKIHISRSGSEADDGIVMKPGEMAHILPDSGLIELREVNTELYTSWINDIWVFDQTRLTEVAERIENDFGVEVTIATARLRQKTLSGSISSKNLQLIKKGLSTALDIEVAQSGNRIIFHDK